MFTRVRSVRSGLALAPGHAPQTDLAIESIALPICVIRVHPRFTCSGRRVACKCVIEPQPARLAATVVSSLVFSYLRELP